MKKIAAILSLLLTTSTLFASDRALDCKVLIYGDKDRTIEMNGPCAKVLYLKLDKTAKRFESNLSADTLTENNISCIRSHKNFGVVETIENLPSTDYICQVIQK